jgi:hypothetical protein
MRMICSSRSKVFACGESRKGDVEAGKAMAQFGDIRIGDRCQHGLAMGGRRMGASRYKGVVMAEKSAWQGKRGYLTPAIFENAMAAHPPADNHEISVDPIPLEIEGPFIVEGQGLTARRVDSGLFRTGEGEKAFDQPCERDGIGDDVPMAHHEGSHFIVLSKGDPSQEGHAQASRGRFEKR